MPQKGTQTTPTLVEGTDREGGVDARGTETMTTIRVIPQAERYPPENRRHQSGHLKQPPRYLRGHQTGRQKRGRESTLGSTTAWSHIPRPHSAYFLWAPPPMPYVGQGLGGPEAGRWGQGCNLASDPWMTTWHPR